MRGVYKCNQKLLSIQLIFGVCSNTSIFKSLKIQKLNNFDKMNISKREWFCYKCSLQFDSSLVYGSHLKLLHKQIIETKSIKNEPKTIELLANVAKSDSSSQIVSVQNEMKTFKCDICEYNCSNRSNLKRHVASVHEENKHFKCDFCNYTCSQKSDLKKHVKSVHEGKKHFKCDFCNSAFSQKSNLNTHIASVHEGKKSFKCEFCGKSFSQKSKMIIHIASVHGE